jgi:hypothetical protein
MNPGQRRIICLEEAAASFLLDLGHRAEDGTDRLIEYSLQPCQTEKETVNNAVQVFFIS